MAGVHMARARACLRKTRPPPTAVVRAFCVDLGDGIEPVRAGRRACRVLSHARSEKAHRQLTKFPIRPFKEKVRDASASGGMVRCTGAF